MNGKTEPTGEDSVERPTRQELDEGRRRRRRLEKVLQGIQVITYRETCGFERKKVDQLCDFFKRESMLGH